MKSAMALSALLAVAGCGMETDDRPATFSYIHAAIIKPSCATAACHSTFNYRAMIDMEDKQIALEYWNVATPKESSSIYRQIGGETDESVTQASEAGRMPLDAPLPEADILLIGRWIDDGARDN